MSDWNDKIDEAEARTRELEERLADPELSRNPTEYAAVAKELAGLRPLVEAGGAWRRTGRELAEAREMQGDPEMRELAAAEVERLEAERAELEARIRELLVPKDPNDERSVILEIRAGAGG